MRCAALLAAGPMPLRAMRAAADVPNAGRIVRDNVYAGSSAWTAPCTR